MWTEKHQNGNQSILINFNKDSHNNLLRSVLYSRSCLDQEHGLSLDDSLSTPRHMGDGVPYTPPPPLILGGPSPTLLEKFGRITHKTLLQSSMWRKV